MRSLIALALIWITPALQAAPPASPNVIVILADDMGLDSVSAMNDKMGLETPAIDRLAREGISFTDAHSTSGVCTPTRYSVLTGRYNWRTRLKRGIVGRWERPLIKDQRLTLPELFKAKGYATACIGKWHLGWHWPKKGGGRTEKLAEIDFTAPMKGGPNDHGFDYYFGDDVPNWPPFVWRENDRLLGEPTGMMKKNNTLGVSEGPAVPGWDLYAVLAEYTTRWSEYIRERAGKERPFFLYAPMPSPHTPITPHKTFQGRSKVSGYADFLIQTDHAVGEMMRALEETEQADNTLVFFTCDNGTSPRANFAELEAGGIRLNEYWRGWKADAYEGGHRVPFIVRWPGRIRPGTRSEQTITLADIMATCADAVGHPLPANAGEDSVSLLPVLEGKGSSEPIHDVVVHHSVSGHFAVRKGPWKLLFCQGSGGWSPPREREAAKQGLPAVQLYNLSEDPKETKNLQAEHPERVKELTADLCRLVERGRSTAGSRQPNHDGATWWSRLPWPQPAANAFFTMDNGIRDVKRVEEKATLLSDLGYDGVTWRPGGTAAAVRAMKARGIEMTAFMMNLKVTAKPNALPVEELKALKGTGAIVWVQLNRGGGSDADAVRALGALNKVVQPLGLRIAIYPHVNNHVETLEEALRVAKFADDENIGVSLTLCHQLKKNGVQDLAPLLKEALPKLFLVQVSGADKGDTRAMGWDRLIQPLGQGSYDVSALFKTLDGLGYAGPIGVIGYGIKQPARKHLKQSILFWRERR